jgi:hypothetical protein
MLLAAFILPVAIMYPVTGALYTWGVKGGYETTIYPLKLDQPLLQKKEQLVELVTQTLMVKEIPLPSGKPKIKTAGNSFYLEWTGADLDVILEPGTELLLAELKVKQTTNYRRLVQLHKAKGGIEFKIYAAVFATALLTLLLTGCLMALQMPTFRLSFFLSMSTGIAVFIAMVMSS